jgi:hypothetical protein
MHKESASPRKYRSLRRSNKTLKAGAHGHFDQMTQAQATTLSMVRASHACVQPLGPACVRLSLRWKADSVDVLYGLADRHEEARVVSFLLYYSIISGRSGAMGEMISRGTFAVPINIV